VNVHKSVHLLNSEPINEISSEARKIVGVWLMTCGGMTFATVILGGITRLTNSGLSMVDWHPFKEFPPLTRDQWIREFDKYKQFPEFKM
jgi:cytochrome c oxidase assembly protein subunit 15